MTRIGIFFLISAFLFLNGAWADQPDNQGEKLAQACVACHGPQGNSIIPENPSLAGQNQKYFIAQMRAFRASAAAGGRDDPVMQAIAASLTEEQIQALADYFACQTPKPGMAEEKYLARGQSIYRGGVITAGIPACSACHGPDGSGNVQAGFPRVSGQNAAYTILQLEAYKKGRRKTDVHNIMQDIAQKMSDEDMRAVASYMQGLY